MSAREELESKISEALYGIAIRPGKEHLEAVVETGMPIRLSGNERDEGVRLVLDAIRQAGGKVLMPVREGDSVANVFVLDEKHVVRLTQEERRAGVYVDALGDES